MRNEKLEFIHYYAIKMDTADDHDEFSVRTLVIKAVNKRQAERKAREEMRVFNINVLSIECRSYDTKGGAEWQIKLWENYN